LFPSGDLCLECEGIGHVRSILTLEKITKALEDLAEVENLFKQSCDSFVEPEGIEE
jgi:hypothetical protein